MQIWAKGTSTVGAGGGSIPQAVQVPITVNGTIVKPGDVVFCDPINGVVVIPIEKLDEVLGLLPILTLADDRAKEAVLSGTTVKEAFKIHRSNI